jgi:predicted nucleotidyltransferase
MPRAERAYLLDTHPSDNNLVVKRLLTGVNLTKRVRLDFSNPHDILGIVKLPLFLAGKPSMRRDEILKLLREHRAEVKAFGVKSLAVFGSVARDQARPDSDVDVLVEFDPPPTFQRFMDLKFYLEDLLGSRVDLGTPDTLKPRIRARVQSEALHVA